MEREILGRCPDQLLDHMAVEAHPLALDPGARFPQEIARLGQHEIHADLLEHRERGLMDRFDLIA